MEILLDPYAARSCPVKTQHQYDPTIARPGNRVDEALTELFAGGKTFEDEVLGAVSLVDGGTVTDLRGRPELSRDEMQALTLEALGRGDEVVIGGVLPIDREGHRRGQADMLVRCADRSDGRPGYRPVEVKRHKILEQTASEVVLQVSRLDRPGHALDLPGQTVRPSREGDLLQVAHYWRLLDAAGFAGDEPVAGLVGTDVMRQVATGPVISWVQLTRKFIRTFSRTAATGWALRSPLERYDHEFGFRVKVAQTAQRRTGGADDPRPMVAPIVVRECEHCLWWETCLPMLGEDDLSLRINKSPLDVREISVLRSHGINTLEDLATTDVEALMETYLPEVAHRAGADNRLRLAARRASLMLAGVELERLTSDPIELPRAELEIDFDIETSAGDRVYLWGFLVDDHASEPYYHHVSAFSELDNDAEIGLARAAIEWLDEQLTHHPDMRVYHYSDYEVVHMMRLARRSGDPELVAAATRVRAAFVDLFVLVKQHFFGTNGLGLKVVAHSGAGFEWRDDDPGGLNSQRWFADALTAGTAEARAAARTRVLEYNEDDVLATHQLRAWLRSLEATAGETGSQA